MGVVYLTGFMGSGKSTVGRRLADRLGVAFIDLDGEIERRAGLSIAEIFDREGEAGFRRRERGALARVATADAAVVATGGGLPEAPANRELMRASGVTVWLDTDFETAIGRLDAAGVTRRPLLSDRQSARRLYRGRLPAYRECDHRVRVAPDDGPDELAGRIAALLGRAVCAT